MKNNPVIPYAIIAVIGILLVVVISVAGIDQRKAIEDEGKKGGEKQEQKKDNSQAGKTTTDPSKIFQSNCASCHGQDLSGGMGPALKKVGSRYSKKEIKGIIKSGPGAMPPSVIKGKKADAVAKWLSKKK